MAASSSRKRKSTSSKVVASESSKIVKRAPVKISFSLPSSDFYQRMQPVIFVVVIVLAFMVGALWQRVEKLSGGNSVSSGTVTNTGSAESKLSIASLKSYAKELKLDTKKFNSCLDDGKYAQVPKDDTTYGSSVGITGTPGFFINGKYLGGAFPFESFKEVIEKELSGKSSSNIKDYTDQYLVSAYENGKVFDPVSKTVEIGGGYVKGDANAKVTIIEFSDFQCPYCERFFSDTYLKLKTEYVDTGKVKFVYRHFPLTSIHPDAQKAAEASLCAGEQGKFWEFHDKLFGVQKAS